MDIVVYSDRKHTDEVQPNIVVPFSDATSWVLQAARLNFEVQGLRPRFENVSGALDSDFRYAQLIGALWDVGEPFILVEHDILPWPGALADLWQCDCAWGAFGYYVFGEVRAYLGCTKFDPARLGPRPFGQLPPWASLDLSVTQELMGRGHSGHLHGPPVVHLNSGHKRVTTDQAVTTGSTA